MSARKCLLIGHLFVCMAGVPCIAQTVSGHVRAGSPREGIPGVIVQLIDSAGLNVARALSRDDGSFAVRAPMPGPYSIRALRLGFRPSTFGPFVVEPHGIAGLELELHGAPVTLAALQVNARRECESATNGDSGGAVLTIWEEARKALLGAVLSRSEHDLQVTTTLYERTLLPGDGRVVRQVVSQRTGRSDRPFASPLRPEAYDSAGFRDEDSSGTLYRAPDADVLLSESFAGSHCLRGVQGAAAAEIGVSFEPRRSAPAKRADGHAFVDVAGTLWLDRSSSRLLRADFRYTGIEPAALDAKAGGALEFLYLPGGLTVISAWRMRVPRLNITRVLAASPSALGTTESSRLQTRVREEVREIWEFGGELSRAKVGDSLYQGSAEAEVRGVVSEGRGLPARGAAVLLDGTSYVSVTDSLGRFHLSGVLPGNYRLLVRSRVAALFGLPARPAASISLHPGESAQTQIEAMTALEAVAARCAEQASGDRAAVYGVATTSVNDPAPHALVHVSWPERFREMSGGFGVQRGGGLARTDSLGQFFVCGVQRGLPLDFAIVTDSSAGAVLGSVRVLVAPESTYSTVHIVARASTLAQPPAPVASSPSDSTTLRRPLSKPR